jgi:ABC-type dipeptide/oligopeptide/nickel transport system permease component
VRPSWYPVIVGFVLVAAVFVVVANILVDLGHTLPTPASG